MTTQSNATKLATSFGNGANALAILHVMVVEVIERQAERDDKSQDFRPIIEALNKMRLKHEDQGIASVKAILKCVFVGIKIGVKSKEDKTIVIKQSEGRDYDREALDRLQSAVGDKLSIRGKKVVQDIAMKAPSTNTIADRIATIGKAVGKDGSLTEEQAVAAFLKALRAERAAIAKAALAKAA
mgnify:CR=1 FL=1|tara:strand:- start:115 stop:666 length:552 start_codon:yes stop_codon:yes gene_type:complete